MDPNATLRAMREHLEDAKRNRDGNSDDSADLHAALDLSLCLLQWVASGGFQPEQLPYHVDKLRELLP